MQYSFGEELKTSTPISKEVIDNISQKLDRQAMFHVKVFSVSLKNNTVDLKSYLASEDMVFKNTDELTSSLSEIGKTSIKNDLFMSLHSNEISSIFNHSLARDLEINIQPRLIQDNKFVIYSTFTFDSINKNTETLQVQYSNQNMIHLGEVLVFCVPDFYTNSYSKLNNFSVYKNNETYYTVIAINLLSIN